MCRWYRVFQVFAALLGVCNLARASGPEGIVIDTDRSINCTSLKTMVDDICRGCRTDQDKAIAIYNFMVRTVWMDWHSHRPLEMQPDGRLLFVNDPVKYIVVYGFCGCGPQAGVHGALCRAAGLGFRQLDPGFGHVSGEVFWAGGWHWMDVWLPAYVTDGAGQIYSYDEIMADRTRFSKARDEGRVPRNFMVNYDADVSTIVNAKNHKPAGDPYEQRYTEDLCLRPGESCTWLWDNVGKWYSPSGPYLGRHLEGQFPSGPAAKFGNDRVLAGAFEYWQPYAKTIPDGPHSAWNKIYYRYYGNSLFVTEPPMTRQGLADIGAELTDLEVSREGLVVTRPGGQMQMGFQLPYVIADTQIEGVAEMKVGGAVSFCFSTDGGKTWLLGGEVKQSGSFGPISIGKPNTYEYPAGSTSGHYGFLLKVVLRANSPKTPTVLKSLKVTNTTMLNFYSRPWLEPGDNRVTVTATNGDSLSAAPLEIAWSWQEDGKNTKSFAHRVARSGATCTIPVGGDKRPRMLWVAITCPPRPESAATGPARGD
jgi:hypothetical protein